MIRTSLGDISDDEFEKIVVPFDNEINSYIDNEILSEFIAYYIATGYKMSAIWNSSLKTTCNTATECLCDCGNFDYGKIKKILKNKYKLEIINEDKLDIKEL